MPRIIPRLLKALREAPYKKETLPDIPPAKKKRQSLWKPNFPQHNFTPAGRTSSVLLDELNPLVHKIQFRRHKRMPPRVRTNRKVDPNHNTSSDPPRRMTVQEREWNASPYLRMLSSPLRTCFVTQKLLPLDFMIRVSPIQLPVPRTAKPVQVLLPDGLNHPRFKARKAGFGHYIYCNRATFGLLQERGNYRRLSTNLTMNSNITEQVGHMLRFRVLQELELLADRLQCRPQNSDRHVVIRKLSRAEFREIRNTGIIPFENGVALLIVPPLNKDSVTKKRPESSYSPLPIQEEQTKPPIRAALPVSVLYPTQEGDHSLSHTQVDDIIGLPKAQIPLYNGVSLFPSRTQRAALYDGLNRLLLIERRARWRENGPLQKDGVCPEEDQQQEPENSSKRARGDQRASHAYLICSDAGTMLRADSAALAIALWRLRMWEGLGSMHGTGERDPGWRITRPKKLPA